MYGKMLRLQTDTAKVIAVINVVENSEGKYIQYRFHEEYPGYKNHKLPRILGPLFKRKLYIPTEDNLINSRNITSE